MVILLFSVGLSVLFLPNNYSHHRNHHDHHHCHDHHLLVESGQQGLHCILQLFLLAVKLARLVLHDDEDENEDYDDEDDDDDDDDDDEDGDDGEDED